MCVTSCCQNCGSRYVGCHAECRAYASWKAEKAKEAKWLRETDYREEKRKSKILHTIQLYGEEKIKAKYNMYK